MMQDIRVSPKISSSNFPSSKVKQSSAFVGDCKHFYDHTDKNGSSISEEFFCKTENNEDIWNACSTFLDEEFDKEMGYDTSCKKTFQMGHKSPESLKSGAYKMESYAFEDLLPMNWSSATAMKEINMGEPLASFSTDKLEDDFDFDGASRARLRLDGNLNAQNLIPEDVRDNSSLLSEESSSSTAVRGESVVRSPSRIVTGEKRGTHRNAFAGPRNKCSTNEEKSRRLSNPSKRKSSHFSNSILQEEEMVAHNSWQFEERYASVDRSSVTTSFCRDLEANFSVFGGKNRAEDPFSVFTTPELHNKASPSFGGFKNAATLADSPPCSFNSEKFAFDCLTAFPNFQTWPTSPSSSPDFQFKEGPQDTGGFRCETSSTNTSVKGSVSKEERKMKLQEDRYKGFEQEDIFMGDNELSSEKKMAGDAPTSSNHALECEGTEDTNPKTTLCLETADSPVNVEEISSSLKTLDKNESQVDNTKNNCDAETPLKCKITKEGQVIFESYVFQLLRVQKVLKGACTTPGRNNTFLGPGSNKISSHQN